MILVHHVTDPARTSVAEQLADILRADLLPVTGRMTEACCMELCAKMDASQAVGLHEIEIRWLYTRSGNPEHIQLHTGMVRRHAEDGAECDASAAVRASHEAAWVSASKIH